MARKQVPTPSCGTMLLYTASDIGFLEKGLVLAVTAKHGRQKRQFENSLSHFSSSIFIYSKRENKCENFEPAHILNSPFAACRPFPSAPDNFFLSRASREYLAHLPVTRSSNYTLCTINGSSQWKEKKKKSSLKAYASLELLLLLRTFVAEQFFASSESSIDRSTVESSSLHSSSYNFSFSLNTRNVLSVSMSPFPLRTALCTTALAMNIIAAQPNTGTENFFRSDKKKIILKKAKML